MRAILIVIISLFLFGCGTRQREVNVSKEESKTRIESSGSEKTTSKENTKSEKQNTSAGESSGSVERSTSEKGNVITEDSSERNTSEKQNESYTKTSKVKEYYENGNPKSESETNESMSKEIYRLNSEIDYLKSRTQNSKEEITKLITENKQLSFSNESLVTQVKSQKEINQKLTAENNSFKKGKDIKVRSSRPMWWLYGLLYLIGMATIPLIKLFINNRVKLKQ
ncbi:hypothetical protein I4P13_15780 [Elizabethkingia meningoseptica]|uniref:coiled-coil domain-containing protein 30 n=1 Tax=Elizabethkingia meningoseptica TaxID=238 RepID=UPI001A301829|nr:coiled-coil domain-containing protein 30 [Elizabethkingia meningoseptica]MBG0515227.1 hypothetical protein [Elizabethkingia meningoseptica]